MSAFSSTALDVAQSTRGSEEGMLSRGTGIFVVQMAELELRVQVIARDNSMIEGLRSSSENFCVRTWKDLSNFDSGTMS